MLRKVLLVLFCLLTLIGHVQAQTVKIFVTNDVHGYIDHTSPDYEENIPGRIGYAYLKGYVKSSSADVKYLMDAGDTFSGNVYTKVDFGKSIAKLMGMMDYNYLSPGNHAFDFDAVKGEDYYSSLLDTLRLNQKLYNGRAKDDLCVALAQNVHFEDGSTLRNNIDKPVVIYDETAQNKNGLRIIAPGILTPARRVSTGPNNMKSLVFGDRESVLQGLEKSLSNYSRKNDIVLVLAHVGDVPEKESFTGVEIAKVKNVDIVVDAHSHNLHYPEKIGESVYVIAGKWLEQFVEITIKDEGDFSVGIVDYAIAVKAEPDEGIAEMVDYVIINGGIASTVGSFPEGVSFSWSNNETRLRTTDLGRFIVLFAL